MIRTILIPLLAASTFWVSSAFADVPAYGLVKDKSTLKFVAIQNNAPVEGTFDEFSADIRFDPDHLDQSVINVEVNTASINASNDDIKNTLKTVDWLSVQGFPTATYKTEKIMRMPGSDNYYTDGKLTLRGKTFPAVLNFQLEKVNENRFIAKGYLTLHRNDFDVGQGEWAKDDVVKNEVRVEFRVMAEKK